MPLWRIFHPPSLYTPSEKATLARAITSVYTTRSPAKLPAFYVNVLFVEYAPGSFFIGGEPVTDFVRFAGEHIARHMQPDEVMRMRGFMSWFEEAIAPFTKGKGINWEVHIDQTPFELWRVQGMAPPQPQSEGERLWRERGEPVVYEGMVAGGPPGGGGSAGPASSSNSRAGVGMTCAESKGLISGKA